VAISAVSGTSGAGRKADVALSFSEVFGDVRPYRVGAHQHAPEISQGLERHSGRAVRVTFVPHLVPIERGIIATVILPLDGELDQAHVLDHYRSRYKDSSFVRILDHTDRLPAVRNVVGTNFCDLAPVVDHSGRSLVVIGAIDNLVKGAAGQAVQVLNICFGLPEATGLLPEAS
jgi:N-acetyl-gamma-glutamyl-phosphate reductase